MADISKEDWIARFVAEQKRLVSRDGGKVDADMIRFFNVNAMSAWSDRDEYDDPEDAAQVDMSYWDE